MNEKTLPCLLDFFICWEREREKKTIPFIIEIEKSDTKTAEQKTKRTTLAFPV
jgi:hypothetical protein